MSFFECEQPVCLESAGTVELIVEPKMRDLGEFSVRRVLPAAARRMVGPFIFFDHMGPAEFAPGKGIQVRPHPHIGIATITYLFEGQIMHRDSLGFVQSIRPGAVNLMTAGRGIVHSERAGDDLDSTSRLHGIQSWIALPDGQEEIEPAFQHYAASSLPSVEVGGAEVRLIIGEAYGQRSPVRAYSSTLYLACRLAAGGDVVLPAHRERAAYVVSGRVRLGGRDLEAGTMAVVARDAEATVEAQEDSMVMVIGGDPVGERHIWWNLVSSSEWRIEQAKSDWREGRFEGVPGDAEFIPLPD